MDSSVLARNKKRRLTQYHGKIAHYTFNSLIAVPDSLLYGRRDVKKSFVCSGVPNSTIRAIRNSPPLLLEEAPVQSIKRHSRITVSPAHIDEVHMLRKLLLPYRSRSGRQLHIFPFFSLSCLPTISVAFLFFFGPALFQQSFPGLMRSLALAGETTQSNPAAFGMQNETSPYGQVLEEAEHPLVQASEIDTMPAGMAYIFSIAIAVGPAATSADPAIPQTYPDDSPQYSEEALAEALREHAHDSGTDRNGQPQPLSVSDSAHLVAAAPSKTVTDGSVAGDAAYSPGITENRNGIPIPQYLAKKGISAQSPQDSILAAFLDMPYRNDGAINEFGEFTLFAKPETRFTSAGLNCSGLVLGASRFLLAKNITIAEAKRDRLQDSGPDSQFGEDWDFGWDLIMNISDGFQRRLLLPGNKSMDPAKSTGLSPRGYDIQSEETWRELPGRLRPGYLYLFSLSMEGRRKGYGLIHYHVGLTHVDKAGQAWFYQTTGKGEKANRRDLKTAKGQASFKRSFANTGKNRKMMLVVEVKLP